MSSLDTGPSLVTAHRDPTDGWAPDVVLAPGAAGSEAGDAERALAEAVAAPIWAVLATLPLSVSHDRWHLERVLGYALGLRAIHGGDLEVLVPAVLLHDLGRTDEGRQHGLASVEASTEQAAAVLGRLAYPEVRIARVLDAIAEHDQPEVRPASIEGRILKDADFLAGFGAWGILRIAMWSGETGRDVGLVLDRMVRGMARRADHLEFTESAAIARRELVFTRLFVERLRTPPAAVAPARHGVYVLLEGISGSGKDTQAQLLRDELGRLGYDARVVCEPHGDYRGYRIAWAERHGGERLTDPAVMRWLLMADRQQLINETVRPALAGPTTVVSVRSYVSTLVYQTQTDEEAAQVALAHAFVPEPDLVVLLDVPAEVAWERIQARQRERGVYETEEQLAAHRTRYRDVCRTFFANRHVVVDATTGQQEVARGVLDAVRPVVRSRQSGSRHDGSDPATSVVGVPSGPTSATGEAATAYISSAA